MKAPNKAEKALVDLLVKVLMRELAEESQQGAEKTCGSQQPMAQHDR